ncbi:hypothetical protein N008_02980 [Hymenobacter sp. APR13]|nr:hypothetical protein N008_02980 [Hymenobacter sp. APR13]
MNTTLPPTVAAADAAAATETPLVGIIMGSQSDLKIMSAAAELLRQFNVPYEITLVSAHRTPHRLV